MYGIIRFNIFCVAFSDELVNRLVFTDSELPYWCQDQLVCLLCKLVIHNYSQFYIIYLVGSHVRDMAMGVSDTCLLSLLQKTM